MKQSRWTLLDFKTSTLKLLNHLLFQSGPSIKKNSLAVKFHNSPHSHDQVVKELLYEMKVKKDKVSLNAFLASFKKPLHLSPRKKNLWKNKIKFLNLNILEAISSKLGKSENQFNCTQT